jgi:hypothetical protein
MLCLFLFDFVVLGEANSRFSVEESVVVGWVFVVE